MQVIEIVWGFFGLKAIGPTHIIYNDNPSKLLTKP